MNVIICEDKMDYIHEIVRIAKNFFSKNDVDVKIVYFTKYADTLNYIKSLSSYADCLYILDIGLKEDKNGLMLGREIRNIDGYAGEMIYITAYVHQVNSVFKYKLRILDFIDKGYKLQENLNEALELLLKITVTKKEASILFKEGANVYLINPSDIVWIETDKQKKRVIIHLQKEDISTHQTLVEIQGKLTSDFIRIHRSVIVNKNHIQRIEQVENDLYVVLIGNVRNIISKRKEKEFKKCIT